MHLDLLKKTIIIFLIVFLNFSPVKSANECFESTSRAIFKFNMAFDDAILEPISRGYNKLPDPIKAQVILRQI